MPDKEQYTVAVIGSTGRGNYGHGIDTVWLELPRTKIVAVADDDAEGLSRAKERLDASNAYRDYREMLAKEKPDLVAVCPRWLDQHQDMVLAAVEAKALGIYMEKPFCRTLEEADRIVQACEAAKVKLAIAHQTRYSPKLEVIRRMIDEGKIGELLELRGQGKDDQRGGGEDLWVLGSHVMNLIHYFGGEAEWCSAQVEQDGEPVSATHVKEGNEGIGLLAGDSLRAMYGLASGATGYFRSRGNVAGTPSRFGLTLYGSEGVITMTTGSLPDAHWLPDSSWTPGRSGKEWVAISSEGPGEEEPLADGGLHGGNLLACRDLLNAIEQDRQPECNVYEARATVEMIAAVFEAHRLKRRVAIPLENRQNPLAAL